MQKANHKPTKRIEQADAMGCAIATLAMATGVSYDRMRVIVGEYWDNFKLLHNFTGLDMDDERIILFRMGYSMLFLRPLKHTTLRTMYSGPCIMIVPSLNLERGYHSIYWDGKKLHDPSPLKRYTEKTAWEAAKGLYILRPIESSYPFGLGGENHPAHQKKFKAKVKKNG